jgi:hypothetical protein
LALTPCADSLNGRSEWITPARRATEARHPSRSHPRSDHPPGPPRPGRFAHITRRLKNLAGELGVAILVLSQLNREVTRRSDHRPHLADLAESGAIEQDTDQVAFVHRPEVYAPDDLTLRARAEVIIAKHRHGETGTVELAWAGATTSFRNPVIPISGPAPAGPDPF